MNEICASKLRRKLQNKSTIRLAMSNKRAWKWPIRRGLNFLMPWLVGYAINNSTTCVFKRSMLQLNIDLCEHGLFYIEIGACTKKTLTSSSCISLQQIFKPDCRDSILWLPGRMTLHGNYLCKSLGFYNSLWFNISCEDSKLCSILNTTQNVQ